MRKVFLTALLALSSMNAATISQTFYYPPGSPGAVNCTPLSAECATTNLDPNGAPTQTFNVEGFQSLASAGSILNSVTITTTNWMVVNSVLVNNNAGAGTYDVYGNDTSKLSLNASGSNPFYQDSLDTEEVLVTVPGFTPTGIVVNLWANDGGAGANLYGSNSADQVTGGCNYSPNPTSGNCGDYDHYKHGGAVTTLSNGTFDVTGTVPVYWTDTTTNVASTLNLTSTNPTQYTGIELTVTYNYTDPPPSTPEPATISLIGASLIGLAALRRKKA